jgi:hypothetical protein
MGKKRQEILHDSYFIMPSSYGSLSRCLRIAVNFQVHAAVIGAAFFGFVGVDGLSPAITPRGDSGKAVAVNQIILNRFGSTFATTGAGLSPNGIHNIENCK